MLVVFKAIAGQSIDDVVLNTYGTVNLRGKLISDNGVDNINGITATGDEFVFDTDFIADQNMYDQIVANRLFFRTGIAQRFLILDNENLVLQTEEGLNLIT